MALLPVSNPKGYNAQVVSGPQEAGSINDWELQFARRALRTLKESLGPEGVKTAIQPKINQSETWWRERIAHNAGNVGPKEYRPAHTVLDIHGLTAEEFMHWFTGENRTAQSYAIDAQPEHFRVVDRAPFQVVIENLGPHPTEFQIKFGPADHESMAGAVLDDYPIKMTGSGQFPDGPVFGHVFHQFKTTPTGFIADLKIFFPASVPDDLLEQHRRHLAVEFRNWTTRAYQMLKLGEPGNPWDYADSSRSH